MGKVKITWLLLLNWLKNNSNWNVTIIIFMKFVWILEREYQWFIYSLQSFSFIVNLLLVWERVREENKSIVLTWNKNIDFLVIKILLNVNYNLPLEIKWKSNKYNNLSNNLYCF